MRRAVVITVLCGLCMSMAWQYGLSLDMLMAHRTWVWGSALALGSVIASIWLCAYDPVRIDMAWYLALFPGLGMFSAGIGSDCDDRSVVHGRRI